MTTTHNKIPAGIAFVGRSNSGKTTLIEKLLPVITARGYQVGTLKHTHHDIDLGDLKKDSNRHKKAGASMVVVASPTIVSLVKTCSNPPLTELLHQFTGMDLVIVEGFKSENLPKIEVHYSGTHKAPLNLPAKDVVAVATNQPDPRNVRQFGLDDINALADFIEARFLKTGAKLQIYKEE